MQNAEVFRRGVVLPLDQEAEASLRVDNVDQFTKVRYLSLNDDRTFEALWQAGLFSEINAQCGSLLDEYEEELVEASSVPGILSAIELVSKCAAAQESDVVKFLEGARELINEATMLSRPIIFVL